MESRVFLITGTSRGIGRALAARYTARGHQVIGCSRSELAGTSSSYRHFVVDVADEEAVRQMFYEIRQAHAGIDVLINNAGVAAMNHSLLTTGKQARAVVNTNVIGTFLVSREAAKMMRGAGGRIVNLGSVATPLALEGEAIYAASKAAVVSLTEVLAKEFASFEITVNAVGPTVVDTDLTKRIPEDQIAALLARQAISRRATIDDVANVIDFFVSPESALVTGQVVYLGGV